MKFTLIFVATLFAFAASQNAAEEPSVEGIWSDFGKAAKQGLKDMAKHVGKEIINKAKDILTDRLRLAPTKEVREAFQNQPSHEGIFQFTGDLILKKAAELAAQHQSEAGFSHEGIVSFGPIYKVYEAEQFLSAHYNKTIQDAGPSHEGIFGGLGGLVMKGLGSLLGGQAGDIIQKAGDVVGNLFFALPQAASQEELFQGPSHEGILSSAGKVLLKGTAKLAGGLVKAAFSPIASILGNIFLARGNFYQYPTFYAPAMELIAEAKSSMQPHQHPEAQYCFEIAENNFTTLFDNYSQRGQNCMADCRQNAEQIVAHVQDIVLDAIQKVEDAHREAGYCFEKDADDDKITCLNKDIPSLIQQHREKIFHYGNDLADYVKQFSNINTDFDVCLVRHLGEVRREIYYIVEEFHYCVDHYSEKRQ